MSQERPDILLLTADSLRADHCGFLNADSDLTPTLDSLAENGVVFENAIAPGPRTPSSLPDVFTGEVFGPRPTVDEWNLRNRKHRISTHLSRFRTIAERLQELGYHTSAVTANPWTHYLPDTTFKKGFDEFTEIDGTDLFDPDTGTVPRWLYPIDAFLNATGIGSKYNWRWKKDWFVQWPHIFDLIKDQFEVTGSPTFFWVCLLDTHEPYLSPADIREENNVLEMYYAVLKDKLESGKGESLSKGDQERLVSAYRDAVRSVDQFVSRFLEECGEDTTIVFHSDHGEAFGDHGLWGHKSQLYRENLHVPLLISGNVNPSRVQEPVSLRSIPPMLLDIANDPALFDPERYAESFIYATTEDGRTRALTSTDWKYITGPNGSELYSLVEDPGEQSNLAEQHQDIVSSLGRLENSLRTQVDEKASIAGGVERIKGV